MTLICGDFSPWLDNLCSIQSIMQKFIIPIAWEECRAEFNGSRCSENEVTEKFVNKLRQFKRKLKNLHFDSISFQIHMQPMVNPGDERHGYPDIFISLPGDDEEIYLAYECKWIKGSRGEVSKYCGKEGIGRFESGKYSPHVGVGNMIAYVFSKDVGNAENKICSYMRSHNRPVPIPHKDQQDNMRILISTHQRDVELGRIQIMHFLLPYLPK